MAGKSSKGKKNKRVSHNSTNPSERIVSSDDVPNDNFIAPESSKSDTNGILVKEEALGVESNQNVFKSENSSEQKKQGEFDLYPISVKTLSGEKLELQLHPGDSVMDVKQFLLESPDTCFFTCYDLLLHEKDGSVHQVEDYSEISEVADITMGGCFLEMADALYDDRSIRAHVQRTRELLSQSTLQGSLSTSLALQREKAQKDKTQKVTIHAITSVKSEFQEHDRLGFMEDVTGSLPNLLMSPPKEIKCVESIVFSSFNPPPNYRRLVGDLIYLDIVTLENNKYCITGNTRTFYVNSSTGNTLDPRPSKVNSEATTLAGVLQKISSKFKKAVCDVLEQKASAHPFENVHSFLSQNSWLGLYPVPDHKRNAARAENALTLSYGSELIGMQRDWNEELQSFREFPHTTHQERILRNRALYKVSSDFVGAAVNGAIAVISRCIPPINPIDPEGFHMYMHNNIFYSFAVDTDVEILSKKRLPLNTSKIVSANSLDGRILNGGGSGSSNAVEISGARNSAPEISVETQLTDNEIATYASTNNDLKGTKAYQEADVHGLYNLAMAIIDYRGHRIVAQSALPGILQGNKSDSLLYGSIDNGKKIYSNQDFHAKVLEASRCLHLKEHGVFDSSGNVCKLAAPVECKGILGSDGRHYLLDVTRVTPRDVNYTVHGSQFCILRPELITAFCEAEAAGRLKAKGVVHDATGNANTNNVDEIERTAENVTPVALDSQDITNQQISNNIQECHQVFGDGDACGDILFNPNVFTDFKLSGNEEDIASDEENVRKVSRYLTDIVLPTFVQDLCTLEVSPMDGQTLTEALHSHGINIRYIGKVANGTKHLPHLWDLCSQEIVVRSTKHIFKDILRDTEDHDLGSAISHFFNCFFGDCQALLKSSVKNIQIGTNEKNQQSSHQSEGKNFRGQTLSNGGLFAKRNQSTYMIVSSESLWTDIIEFTKLKYQFEVLKDARSRVKKIAVIRNLCQKVGITIAARKYDLSAEKPFQTEDILNLQPVVKHSVPICSDSKDLMKIGKDQLAQGKLSEAYTLFSEAFSILQQVTGPMHRDVADCCRYLAMVLYHAGDMAGAINQQHKELIINERCLGLDHPDTAHSYGNMALFYHGLCESEHALRHMSRALSLLSFSCGPDHPDVAAIYINVSMMYQDIGRKDTALRYLQEALKKNERLLGKEHIQTAVCYHALAFAFNSMGAYKLSHQHEKKTYDILVKQLGEEDSRTRDSQNWMKTFKIREIQLAMKKQKDQADQALKEEALNAAATPKQALDYCKAHPEVLQKFGGFGGSCASLNKPFNIETIPRGRKVDERAVRAAAEVRKKAEAKGLLARHTDSPLLTKPDKTVDTKKSAHLKKEANGQRDSKQDQAPVGLGRGLVSLDAKKPEVVIKKAAA